jgi:predicted RNase H-like HicB family nuclease
VYPPGGGSTRGESVLDQFKNNIYTYNMIEYSITLTWDDEASVWIAESDDIPGLILESESFDKLIERVKTAVPDLLELEGKEHPQTKLHFKAERLAVVA